MLEAGLCASYPAGMTARVYGFRSRSSLEKYHYSHSLTSAPSFAPSFNMLLLVGLVIRSNLTGGSGGAKDRGNSFVKGSEKMWDLA